MMLRIVVLLLFCTIAASIGDGNGEATLSKAELSNNASCPNVLVTFYSASSAQWTAKMALAVSAGAASSGANVRLLRTNETTCDDLLWADGVALGSPVYWATGAPVIPCP